MLKFPRTAPGRFRWATFALVAAALAAFWGRATDSTSRDGVFERSAKRLTTDVGEVWESVGVQTKKSNVFGDWGKSASRRGVEPLRADFDERLRVGATEFWASRRSGPRASGALRAVADGWARWNVGAEATARFLETLTTVERSAFDRRRRESAAFDFATERAASEEASREASATLAALKLEAGEGPAEFDGGLDAALTFLRSLDGNETASDDGRVDCNKKEEKSESGGETFLWAAAFDGNPLNAVGAFAAADFIAISDSAAVERARRAFASSATFFFLSTFGAFGGVFPRAWTALWGVGGESRLEREFWRFLDATFRRLGVALANLGKLLSFARLALFNAFRRFDVEDGLASRRTLAALCASTRLLI
ncbi:MAG: hypothetical protein IKU86_02035 [Thermoguttaceae bacterium]|nr:hypothetical protein [Thermoguttaceae bacterium]